MRRPKLLATLVAVAVTAVVSLTPAAANAAQAKPAGGGSDTVQSSSTRGGAELSARAAAGVADKASYSDASWFSGTMAPGAQKGWVWNNSLNNYAYRVGLSPAGASTSAPCNFEVVDQWYEGLRSGERKFHFVIRNVGGISCGATVELSSVDAPTTRSTGGLNPGETATFYESSIDESSVYQVAVSPYGATSTDTCKFKVVDTWYDREPRGDVATPEYLYYTVQNVGNIACSANVEVGTNPIDTYLANRTLSPGASYGTTMLSASPTTAVFMIGVLVADTGCAMEITKHRYVQVINSSGTTTRQLQLWLKNVGTITCTGRPTLSRI